MTVASSHSPATQQQAPTLGRSHRLLGRLHFTSVFWYRFAHWAFTRLPAWTDWVAVVVFTTVFFLTLGRIRAAVASNIQPVLGPARIWTRWGRSYRTLWVFAWCLTERYRRLVQPETFRSVLEGEEHWRLVTEAGGGFVLVTAHIGPWESASYFGASKANRRIHVVREKEINPHAQDFVREILTRSGDNYVTHFAGNDLGLSFELADALRQGDIVALQGDRPRAGGRTVTVSLFDRAMPLPVGPVALARAAGVPLMPVFNFRDGRFLQRAVVRPPIHVARTADREADVGDAVRRLGAEIEWAIRHRPYQWFCFRKLWE